MSEKQEKQPLFSLKLPDTEDEDYKFYLLESGYGVLSRVPLAPLRIL